ncbi:MAG TPA: hypothetical protein VFC67_04730 [Prolixibacteraceae bacterium]|nr:hypothetical protein [Prolixibacteraceae bacterium]
MKLQTTIILVLISMLSFGQVDKNSFYNPKDYPDAKYSVKIDTFSLKAFKVELVQVKLKAEPLDNNSAYCRIWLTVKSGNTVIDKLFFPECHATGGCSGIFADGQPSKDYVILSKFGDNSGQLIIIDSAGKIQTYPGGGYAVSDDLKYLFSVHESNAVGVTVFDLSKNKMIFLMSQLKSDLADFYRSGNKYFVVEIDDDATNENQTNIFTFDFAMGYMIKSTVNDQYVEKAIRLKAYNRYNFAPCNCGQKK